MRTERSNRSSSRAGSRRRERGVGSSQQQAIAQIVRKLAPIEVINQEEIEGIHRASMRLLSDIGIQIVDYPNCLETFRQHGAKVEGDVIKIDEDTLMHFVRMAPASFTQLARNPQNNLVIGGNHTVFAPVYGPPYVADLDRGRRSSTIEDFQNFTKLQHTIPELQHGGGTLLEPNDIHVDERHLDMLMAHILYHDKCFMGSVTHIDNARDSVTMSEILFGKEAIRQNPATISLINAGSPMRFDDRMLGALEVYAKARQACIIAPFIVVGAMSPSTLAGTLAQQNAESLFGICYAQMLEPGAPCLQGPFLPVIDMKSGAPCFGTPESALAVAACGQLARHYNLPLRSGGNLTASRTPDAQAGVESANTLWPTIQAGVHFALHSAGWLEGGLISGYEKLIIDAESLGMMAKYAKGISFEEDQFAFDAFEEVGPGGHFLGSAHTMRHYDSAFYQHSVFNMSNYEQWELDGAKDTYKRANEIWKQRLEAYQAPTLDEAIREELEAFVAQRRAEIQAKKPRSEWASSR